MAGVAAVYSGCRSSKPPKIPICIGTGYGGADCKLVDGTYEHWGPTKLKNAWITTQHGMALFSSWCYDAKLSIIQAEMAEIDEEIRSADLPQEDVPPPDCDGVAGSQEDD